MTVAFVESDIDRLCINTIRCLAADMVEKANSGHPGAPMGCAPIAHVLFGHMMRYSPESPAWSMRDRFVLSNGHACALLYSMLHLTGYKDVSMDQLMRFRQLGSITPGHPEHHMTSGVEVSTGPLGQGIANAVGLALASEAMNHTTFTYVLCGDGCLQEGINYEAVSLAGHLGLRRLILIYDDNHISIDGNTSLSFTEDVEARFKAAGWFVDRVTDGDSNLGAIYTSILKAKTNAGPTLIKVRTTIGFGSSKSGTEKVHGAPLGKDEIESVREKLLGKGTTAFHVPKEVYDFYHTRVAAFNTEAHRAPSVELQKFSDINFPSKSDLPQKEMATRATSGEVLALIQKALGPRVIGGSADLTESNLTNKAHIPPFTRENRGGRYIHFGVREHAMAGILNGIAAYDPAYFMAFGATFANFISYMFSSVRLAALSGHRVLHICTHDSIDLGEDGPTHQPIEIFALLRATPNLIEFRPCDYEETIAGYQAYFSAHGPVVLLLSRGPVPITAGSCRDKAILGGYVIHGDESKPADVCIISSGTEVAACIEACKALSAAPHNLTAKVVSLPSWSLFKKQSPEYRKKVLASKKRLFVEASNPLGYQEFADAAIGMTTFGASAPAKDLRMHFGFTVENIVNQCLNLIQGK